MVGSRLTCVDIGQKMARDIFHNKGNKTKAKVSEPELSAMLALAAEAGFNLARRHWSRGGRPKNKKI